MKTLADIQADLEAVEMQMQAVTASMARLYASANQRLMDGPASQDWAKLRDRIADIERKIAQSAHDITKAADWVDEIK
jgi:flagellar biosynthesis chaperone FliJ